MTYLDQEARLNIFIQSGWTCSVCGEDLRQYNTPQLGHKISQTKYNLKKYGKEIIHHRLNMEPVCSLGCNAKVAIGKSKTAEIDRLVAEIEESINISGG